ncbi:hypothetical protein NX059_006356 [Plenodomus lindquistii]|nr:hypothetical protein NX059_006356 [Plenodomus lindquistii]
MSHPLLLPSILNAHSLIQPKSSDPKQQLPNFTPNSGPRCEPPWQLDVNQQVKAARRFRRPNIGTIGTGFNGPVIYDPITHLPRDSFRCIAMQAEYSDYSLEELRLTDYREGRGGARAEREVQNTRTMMARNSKDHMELLRGPGMQVRVGAASADDNTWCLPVALISHYSPFLKAACTREFKEKEEGCIHLPADDPEVFTCFVQWMYYGGSASSASSSPMQDENTTTTHAKSWILADKLLCEEFKDHAMKRLRTRQSMTPQEVLYVCENTEPGSELRNFFMAFVLDHFADPGRLEGSAEEWDEVLMEHADLRVLVLQSFRTKLGRGDC